MTTSITLTRDSGYADRARDYRVMVDDKEIGLIANGQSKVFEVNPGTHNLKLKVDWCSSNSIQVNVNSGESTSCSCGSALRGTRSLLSLFYVIFAPSKYLWLSSDES